MSAVAVLGVLVAAIAVLGVLLSRLFAKAGQDVASEQAQPEVGEPHARLAALAACLPPRAPLTPCTALNSAAAGRGRADAGLEPAGGRRGAAAPPAGRRCRGVGRGCRG